MCIDPRFAMVEDRLQRRRQASTRRPTDFIRTILISAALLLSACLQPAPTSGKLGQRIDHKGYIMTVTQMDSAQDFPDARAARAGNVLVAVELLVESNLRSGVHVSPSHIRLVDGSGRDYKPRSTGKAPILKEQFDISKGSQARGWLTFEVPKGVRKLTLVNELPQDFKYVEVKVALTE